MGYVSIIWRSISTRANVPLISESHQKMAWINGHRGEFEIILPQDTVNYPISHIWVPGSTSFMIIARLMSIRYTWPIYSDVAPQCGPDIHALMVGLASTRWTMICSRILVTMCSISHVHESHDMRSQLQLHALSCIDLREADSNPAKCRCRWRNHELSLLFKLIKLFIMLQFNARDVC